MIDWLELAEAAGVHDCRGAGDRRSVPDDRTERRALRRRDHGRRRPLAAREAPADGGSGARFNVIDYSATGSIKGQVGAASPCKVGD